MYGYHSNNRYHGVNGRAQTVTLTGVLTSPKTASTVLTPPPLLPPLQCKSRTPRRGWKIMKICSGW
jgi:hypothetical protein